AAREFTRPTITPRCSLIVRPAPMAASQRRDARPDGHDLVHTFVNAPWRGLTWRPTPPRRLAAPGPHAAARQSAKRSHRYLGSRGASRHLPASRRWARVGGLAPGAPLKDKQPPASVAGGCAR